MPAPEMVRGNFGPLTIYDPAVFGGVRQPFSNNTIPAERMDPVGRRIAALYPSSNRPGPIDNFAGSFRRNEDRHQLDIRIDHRLSDASHLFVRYSRSDRDTLTTSVFDPPGYELTERQQVPGINAPRASSLVAGETHVFSNAVVHELRTGFSINGADAWSLASRPLFEDFGIAASIRQWSWPVCPCSRCRALACSATEETSRGSRGRQCCSSPIIRRGYAIRTR
ncbi:MAG: hypothetical protein LC753_03180 [Acidobacteria bacterium]|nr:hypothetical protein [Acidobacteriota bacterium]